MSSVGLAGRAVGRRAPPPVPAVLIAGAAIIVAVAAGRFIAEGRIALGIAIVLAAVLFPLSFLDLAAVIGLYVVLLFIQSLSVLNVAPTAIQILILLAWLGTGGVRRGRLPVLQRQRWLIMAMVLLASWNLVSAAWAPDPGRAAAGAGYWWIAVATYVVVASTLTSTRDVRLVAFAFVLGSVISVVLGLLGIGGPDDPLRAALTKGRLFGGGGDPNYQAAGFLAAMFLAAALMAVVPRRFRIVLALSLGLTVIGFFATESRGGLLALGFATLVALLLLPGHRRRILTMVMVGGLGLVVWVLAQPHALKRITDFGGGGSGRSDLWTVAVRIFGNHPLVGVGDANFPVVEPHFVLQPGTIKQVRLVVEAHDVIHNTYLQLMTELGLVGLAGFLVVVVLALRRSWLAARIFEGIGQHNYADLARAVLIGSIGMLAAIFFINDGNDPRLWVLFALGSVLLALAQREERGQAGAPRRRAPRQSLRARPVAVPR